MRFLKIVVNLILAVFVTQTGYGGAILLHKKNATVWLPQQLIQGELSGIKASKLTVHLNSSSFKINVNAGNNFIIHLKLQTSKNKIWVTANQDGKLITSDTIDLTLGYKPVPVVQPYAVVAGNKATLKQIVINNAGKQNLKYIWNAGKGNPAASGIVDKAGVKQVTIPQKDGIYYFDLLVVSHSDTASYQTYVKRYKGKLTAYDMQTDNVSWLDKAVIYEITPNTFVRKAGFNGIIQKLPELVALGITTVWLQPVYTTKHGGQGYDVIDYMGIRPDLGSEAQLGELISKAKALGLKVMFDFVPNHTSTDHPYAVDCAKNGKDSHYYNFYQHSNDGAAYSSNYHTDKQGFVYYFWKDLVNLDYNNPEVQQWMIEACKYWINKYDIDGYRFDAVWGLNARTPSFSKRLRIELKSMKPDFLLLAEDKGSDKNVYARGFDAAYDWTPDTGWVSQWSWQTDHDMKKSLTVFNHPDTAKRGAMLRKQLFNDAGADSRILRFIENNDIPRFLAAHTLAQTKTAAALMFSVPGIPMIYNGQETGSLAHPYSSRSIFTADRPIRSADSNGLFAYYQKLIKLRASYPALRSEKIKEIKVLNTGSILAVHRWMNDEHFLILLNMNSAPVNAKLDLQNSKFMSQVPETAFAKDILTDKVFGNKKEDTTHVTIPMDGFGIRWLLINN